MKTILAFALLATTTTLVHAEDTGRKDPKTGKACVAFISSELSDQGLVRMNFRNTCDSPFRIQIQATGVTRQKSIDAGTPDKPAKTYVSCKPGDQCESAKWLYE
ncbi:MAG TPA: hypothetical protein VHL57_01440 [Flavobacteriales bacterium]|jgi:hypothetical protein|nr:hypothetical protein [Flavobacteriales bacterium]